MTTPKENPIVSATNRHNRNVKAWLAKPRHNFNDLLKDCWNASYLNGLVVHSQAELEHAEASVALYAQAIAYIEGGYYRANYFGQGAVYVRQQFKVLKQRYLNEIHRLEVEKHEFLKKQEFLKKHEFSNEAEK